MMHLSMQQRRRDNHSTNLEPNWSYEDTKKNTKIQGEPDHAYILPSSTFQ
jgi:hypothetical protein